MDSPSWESIDYHQCLVPPTPVQLWSVHLGEISLETTETTPVQLLPAQHLRSSLIVIHVQSDRAMAELLLMRFTS